MSPNTTQTTTQIEAALVKTNILNKTNPKLKKIKTKNIINNLKKKLITKHKISIIYLPFIILIGWVMSDIYQNMTSALVAKDTLINYELKTTVEKTIVENNEGISLKLAPTLLQKP